MRACLPGLHCVELELPPSRVVKGLHSHSGELVELYMCGVTALLKLQSFAWGLPTVRRSLTYCGGAF